MRFSICVIDPEGYSYSHFLYDICKYLCYGIESAGYDCCIVRNKLAADRSNIIVGAHNLKDQSFVEQIKQAGNYIFLQTEIVTRETVNPSNLIPTISLHLMQKATAVWTGIEANIEPLRKMGVEADLLLWGYHPYMEEIHHKQHKDIDFLFCGTITPHRKNLLDQLMDRGGKVVTMFDDAAIYRNDLIARARVHLAPNQGPGRNHLGRSRVLYLINNRSIVVIEHCQDQARYEHCFLWATTSQWVDLCMETMQRTDLKQLAAEYHDRFQKIPMADAIRPLLIKYSKTVNMWSSARPNLRQGYADGRYH